MKTRIALAAFCLSAAAVFAQDAKRQAFITYPWPTSPDIVTAHRTGVQNLTFGPGQVVKIINRYQASDVQISANFPVIVKQETCEKHGVTQIEFVCDSTADYLIFDTRDPRDPNNGPNPVSLNWHGQAD